MNERLQKILARAGYGSRRSAEQLILDGRVSVNGVITTQLGAKADAATDTIAVDGSRLQTPEGHVYLALNKPAGVITAVADPRGRRTVVDLLPEGLPPHVVPVGRLDLDTEGLLLLTNDGELANRLTHPRYKIEKEYMALVEGRPDDASLRALRAGVEVRGQQTAPVGVELSRAPHGYDVPQGHTWLRLIVHEGRKRQVRLMCFAVGLPVRRLVRTRIGGVRLGRLRAGSTRQLSDAEVAQLRDAVQHA